MVAWLSAMHLSHLMYSTSGLVSTGMGDHLPAGKPSQHVVSHLCRLSLLSSVGW